MNPHRKNGPIRLLHPGPTIQWIQIGHNQISLALKRHYEHASFWQVVNFDIININKLIRQAQDVFSAIP